MINKGALPAAVAGAAREVSMLPGWIDFMTEGRIQNNRGEKWQSIGGENYCENRTEMPMWLAIILTTGKRNPSNGRSILSKQKCTRLLEQDGWRRRCARIRLVTAAAVRDSGETGDGRIIGSREPASIRWTICLRNALV